MTNKVVLKNSSVVNKIPQTTDLDFGELAINYADGKLYFKTANNQIESFGSSGSPFLDAGSISDSINNFALIDGGTIG